MKIAIYVLLVLIGFAASFYLSSDLTDITHEQYEKYRIQAMHNLNLTTKMGMGSIAEEYQILSEINRLKQKDSGK